MLPLTLRAQFYPNECGTNSLKCMHKSHGPSIYFCTWSIMIISSVLYLQLHNVNISSYYTDKYALWLDFRTIDDNRFHGLGRRLETTSEGIRLQITKKAESAGKLSCYLYIFQDAQIH